jgi:hypothetical protein
MDFGMSILYQKIFLFSILSGLFTELPSKGTVYPGNFVLIRIINFTGFEPGTGNLKYPLS